MSRIPSEFLSMLRGLSSGLGRRLILLFGGLIAIFATAAVMINQHVQTGMLESRLEARTQALADLLAEVSSSYLYDYRVSELDIILENMMQDTDILTLYVTDADGMIVANGDINDHRFLQFADDIWQQRAQNQRAFVEQRQEGVHRIAKPIFLGTRFLGIVRADISLAKFQSDLAALRRLNTMIGLAFVGAGILLSALVATRVTAPLGHLIRVTEAAAAGDLNHDIVLRTNDEIETLSNSFNQMLQALRQSLSEINTLAYRDILTGLPNRAFFSEYIEAVSRQVSDTGVEAAVFFLDLDHFKQVNDTLGHDSGDELLIAFSRRIVDALDTAGWPVIPLHDNTRPDQAFRAPSSLLARLGGDEFTIVIYGPGSHVAVEGIARQILTDLQKPCQVGIKELETTSSIGIALMPEHGVDSSTIMQNADTAMYQAKQAGRGTFRKFDSDMAASAIDRVMMELDLRQALTSGQLTVHFQPQFHLATGALQGAEALVRWQHPERGLLNPGDFLPIAESAGLMQDIGRIVLAESLRLASDWPKIGDHWLQLAINMSIEELSDRDNVDFILDQLVHHGFDAARLEIEVTERTAMEDDSDLEDHFSLLHFAEVRLAVDDFGVGYSNLSRLNALKFQTLKIDRSLISGMVPGSEAAALVKSILQLAKTLGLEVVAEGVENRAQFEYLKCEGCDFAQGYSLGRPMAPEKFRNFINNLAHDTQDLDRDQSA